MVLLCAAPTLAFCQKECKVKTYVDEFTGVETVSTEKLKMGTVIRRQGANILFTYSNETYTLVLHAHVGGDTDVASVDEGEIYYVKFEDETVEQLANLKFTISKQDFQVGMVYGQGILLTFDLLPEQMEIFATKRIAKTRIASSRGYIQIDPSKKIADDIMACAKNFIKTVKKN